MKRILSILCAIAMMVGYLPAVNAYAAANVENNLETQSETSKIELDNDSVVTIEETDEERIVYYYENDVAKQKAVLDKTTGDIYYYDFEEQNTSSSRGRSSRAKKTTESYTAKYNVQDFLQSNTENAENGISIASSTENQRNTSDMNFEQADPSLGGSSYSPYLKAKVYEEGGVIYQRYLYGYTDVKEYKQDFFNFDKGTPLTVIATVAGYVFDFPIIVDIAIDAASQCLLSPLVVQEWVKEYYWIYEFKQISPSSLEFVCNEEFTYKKERKVELNSEDSDWKVIEEVPDAVIEVTRDEILTSPGLYY